MIQNKITKWKSKFEPDGAIEANQKYAKGVVDYSVMKAKNNVMMKLKRAKTQEEGREKS